MGVTFTWDDEQKRVIRYTADGDWNWTDFHRAVRVSLFALHTLKHPVDTILDLSQSPKTPGGAVAHLRAVGKKQHPRISGRGIVIGLDPETVQKVTASPDVQVVQFGGQEIHFVATEAEAQQLIQQWQAQ